MPWPAPKTSLALALLLLLTLLAAFLVHRSLTPSSTVPANPITTHVYIWQRSWSPAVEDALRAHAPAFNRTIILTRQISWENNQPHLFRVAVNWSALRASAVQIGAAIRIASYPGPYAGPTADFLAQTIRDLRTEAAQNQVTLAEIQFDFDASTARLAGYRQWLSAARPAAAPTPLTITTLPAWLDASDFSPLVHAADGFVLQVHGLDKPRDISSPLVLCDPAAARRAISKASRLGMPFRVALPTYGYAVAFDLAGQFLGMVAEGAPPDWAQGKTVRLAEAQPLELAALVRDLIAAPPPNLQGVIWYRMPVDSDRLNWRWPTLAAVMHGTAPAPATLTLQIKHTGTLSDISLTNTGERDSDAPCKITLSWPAATLIAADALGDTQLTKNPDGHSLTLITPGGFSNRLRPNESRPIAWLRLSQFQEFTTNVEP